MPGHQPPTQYRFQTRFVATAVIVVASLMLASCKYVSIGGGGGGQSPTDAQVNLGITIPAYSTQQGCKGNVTWSLTPVTLTGASGRSSALTLNRDYSVFGPNLDPDYGPQGYSCSFGETLQDHLRAGTWRFQAATGIYSGSCDVNLVNGLNAPSIKVVSGGRCG